MNKYSQAVEKLLGKVRTNLDIGFEDKTAQEALEWVENELAWLLARPAEYMRFHSLKDRH